MTNNAVGEEIAFLRGLEWSAARIAERLSVPIEVVMARTYAPSDADVLEAGRAARREARLVYTRTCPEYGQQR